MREAGSWYQFVFAIKGGSTINGGLAATDTHKGPHTTPPCPYVYDTRLVVEPFTLVKGEKL